MIKDDFSALKAHHAFRSFRSQLLNVISEKGDIVTYKKNDELREIATEMPLDRLLIETDAPFLAPQVKRGKRNEPAYVKYINDFIADLRGIDPEVMANMTTENEACLFGRDVIYR